MGLKRKHDVADVSGLAASHGFDLALVVEKQKALLIGQRLVGFIDPSFESVRGGLGMARPINVQGQPITVIAQGGEDFISLTDILRAKDGDFFISDWLRNRNTIEFVERR